MDRGSDKSSQYERSRGDGRAVLTISIGGGPPPTLVAVVEPNRILCGALARILSGDPRLHVAWTCEDAADVTNRCVERPVDVVVANGRLPRQGLAKLLDAAAERQRVASLVVVVSCPEPRLIRRLVDRRIGGLLDSRYVDDHQLRRSVVHVGNGGRYICPYHAVTEATAAEDGPVDGDVRLTERESDVLAGVASGDSTKLIAARLGVSPRTVDDHRCAIARKTGIHTVAGQTQLALRIGLIPCPAADGPCPLAGDGMRAEPE